MKNETAFPVGNQTNYNAQSGMSLRDYFAAKALAALIVASATASGEFPNPRVQANAQLLSQYAGEYADSMLIEREKQA